MHPHLSTGSRPRTAGSQRLFCWALVGTLLSACHTSTPRRGGRTALQPARPAPSCSFGSFCATEVVAAHSWACAARAGPAGVWCWGSGIPFLPEAFASKPAKLPGPQALHNLAAGVIGLCGREGDGEHLCWLIDSVPTGKYDVHGNPFRRAVTRVRKIHPAHRVRQVSTGTGHLCAVLVDGSVTCRTNPAADREQRIRSARVRGLNGAVQVIACNGWSCTQLDSGEVRCWGENHAGNLGDGTTRSSESPVPAAGLTDVTDLACGTSHTCARTAAGRVLCWGAGVGRQLGDWDDVDRRTPTEVPGLTEVVVIAVGDGHGCAVRSGGEVHCWGFNNYGQAGPRDPKLDIAGSVQVDQYRTPWVIRRPAAVPGVDNAIAVAAGWYFSCAATRDGRVLCWGRNREGELGRPQREDSMRPGPVPL